MSSLWQAFQSPQQHEDPRKHTHWSQTYVYIWLSRHHPFPSQNHVCLVATLILNSSCKTRKIHKLTSPFIAYQCPYPGCGREFNVNSNMRRHWRNHTRLSAVHLGDMDGRGSCDQSPYSPDMLHGQSLASPPATDDSEESDDDLSDDDDSHYAMDMDVYEGCVKERNEVNPHHHRGGSGSLRNSEPFWSRSPSPVRKSTAYSYPRPPPPSSLGRSPSHATEYLYRPSNPAYARSCTDSRVSTALRPAFPCDSSGRSVVR